MQIRSTLTFKQRLFFVSPALALTMSWPTIAGKALNVPGSGVWIVGLLSAPALVLAVAAVVKAWRRADSLPLGACVVRKPSSISTAAPEGSSPPHTGSFPP